MRRLSTWVFVLLAVYSAALTLEEWHEGRKAVRPYFSDIVGQVSFHGVNTTLSAALLAATALVFAMLRRLERGSFRRRAFLVSQVVLFGYLAIDERFMIHEWLALEAGIRDSYQFAAIGAIEIALLMSIGDLRALPNAPRRWLAAAAVLYGTSALVDMLEIPGLRVRLALEDLPKTWAGVCVFLFAWGLLDCVVKGRERPD